MFLSELLLIHLLILHDPLDDNCLLLLDVVILKHHSIDVHKARAAGYMDRDNFVSIKFEILKTGVDQQLNGVVLGFLL